jgi:hypothetical protein
MRCRAVAASICCVIVAPAGGFAGSAMPVRSAVLSKNLVTWSPGNGTFGPTSMKHGDVTSTSLWISNRCSSNSESRSTASLIA